MGASEGFLSIDSSRSNLAVATVVHEFLPGSQLYWSRFFAESRVIRSERD